MYSRYVGLPHPKKIPITFWPNIVIGLTEEHVNLTTYFEGEIMGCKYTFLTQHPDWGSTGAIDLQHWAQFVVPDHRLRILDDASFEGFYYICFNQILGTIRGLYFHPKYEKFVMQSKPRDQNCS